ncbi:M56 family metallopeptidase [Amycolatopsis sp. CA-126428]|uniref:M56 family metallopeptidase n=1 Tax=Amycolatopsis sp. CA-126428 TaxID=2073158 RepID=UPI000CD2637A|nr:M56 family metallopeptidase [Amycolatopsis sp. CA-126428]
MDADLLVPLLLPLMAWPLSRFVAPKLPPRMAGWLLAGSSVVLAAGSTAALLLVAFAGLVLVPAVADAGHWSPDALRSLEAVSAPVSIGAGVVLAVLGVRLVRTAIRYLSWARRVSRELDEHSPDGGVVILAGAEPVAFSAPGRGGRIAVSSGMLAALTAKERCALLAHERAHLALRHHRFLIAVTLSSALNPLLRPLGTAAGFALERWADETAAARVGDRGLVARAVAKAALAGHAPHGGFALAATGGPVPRRVSALLAAPATTGPLAIMGSALVLGLTVLSAQSALDGAADLHDGIEIAQAAAPGQDLLSLRAHHDRHHGSAVRASVFHSR